MYSWINIVVLYSILYNEQISGLFSTCGCVQKGNDLLCEYCIPFAIYQGIQGVNVTNNSVPIQSDTFTDPSWHNVQYVDITEVTETVTSNFKNGCFSNLHSLKYLGLHLAANITNFIQIEEGAFDGLEKLNHLNFTNCKRFSFELLYKLFDNETNFPNLKQLTLANFNQFHYANSLLRFDKNFIKLLGQRNVESVNADGAQIESLYLDSKSLWCYSLKRLSLRNAYVERIYDVQGENNTCASLRFFDGTNINANILAKTPGGSPLKNRPFSPSIIIDLSSFASGFYYLAAAETVIFDNVCPKSIHPKTIRYVFVWEKNLKVALKHVSLRRNHFQYLNIEVHTTSLLKLPSLDLGGNQMEYISPLAFGNITALRNLSLDNNNLGKMLDTAPKEFEDMLQYLEELERVDLSNNILTYIPTDMFKNNLNLKVVLIHNNFITQFWQQKMFAFCFLDISHNEISSLDSKSMDFVDNIARRNLNGTFQVNLRNNYFVCTCNSPSFAKWIVSTKYILTDIPKTCRWKEGVLYLNQTTVQILQDDCTQLKFGWLYGTVAVCLSVSCLTFFGRCLVLRFQRKHRREQRRRRGIMQMQNNDFAYQYLSFVLFSSKDDDLVLRLIRPVLEKAFQNVVGNVPYGFCFGDNEFRPGFGILEEQERCLRESGTALAIVSRQFCTSEYTKKELQMTVDMKKPTILLMTEQVPDNQMFLELRHIFKRNVRAKITIVNGQCVFTPNEEHICQTMLEMIE